MHVDFEWVMVLATLVTGVLWAWHRWRNRGLGERDARPRDPGGLIDLGRSLFPVILVVLVIRSFLVEPFRIPSESMVPTLLRGDFILVNKFAYGVRLPVSHAEIIETGQPERGDVMVFRYPKNPAEDYIKRVVGLPGDTVHYEDKRVYINGEEMPQMAAGVFAPKPDARLREERLGPVNHEILLYDSHPAREFTFTVPENRYFVMGDNRDRSADSRFWGTVPEANLVGEAFLIWFNWDFQDGDMDWSRIGRLID